MPSYRVEQTNFQAGELDPNFHSRSDLKAYQEGAKQIRNFYLMLTGGVMRRPGTTYLANLGAASRIEPFLFSNDERHVVAFQAGGAKIYGIDGTLQQTLTGAPWGADDLFELNITQAADVMIVVHRDYEITQITRTGATSFTRAAYAFDGDSSETHKMPFFKYADSSVTLTPSGTSGSITLTASADTWETAHNGTIIEYTDTAGTVRQMQLGARVSATVINATVLYSATLPNTTAVKTWREQMFSAVRGWPGAATFHDNRLWFGGSGQRPGGLVGSQSGAFYNFELDDGDDDEGIDVTIAGSSVSEILHLVSTRRLEILTDTGEFYISDSDVRTITPGNVSVRRQTTFGASRTPPVFFDGETVFVQRSGQNLRSYSYDFVRDNYASDLLSVQASHLVRSPKQAASTFGSDTRPEQYLLFVNNDGTLTHMHSIREQQVKGFALWSTRSGDTFESACGVAEDMFVVGKRSLNSSTVYTLELLADDDSVTLDSSLEGTRSQYGTPLVDGASQTGTTLNIDGLTSTPVAGDQFTIAGVAGTYTIDRLTYSSGDGALVLTTALASSPADNAVITFTTGHLYSGFSHLANETVHVVSGNLYLGTETVSGSGTITIDYTGLSTIRAGFSYTPTLETMPVVFRSERGSFNGSVRRITRCLVDITGAYDIKVAGNQLAVRQVNDDMSLALQAQSGHYEFPVMGYSREPTITLTQTDPLPLRVLGMGIEVRAY